MFIIALVVAAAAGATMAVQGSLNSLLGKSLGYVPATVLVHGVGLLFALALLMALPEESLELARLSDVPWYAYLGGILGVGIVLAVVYGISQVGVGRATTAIIAAQIFTAVLIDHLGLWGMKKLPFTWHRLAGAVLMIAGSWLLLRR